MYHKMIQYIHIWLYMYHNGDILMRVFCIENNVSAMSSGGFRTTALSK